MKAYSTFALLMLALLLSGCIASPKFDTANVDQRVTPLQASHSETPYIGKYVLWGGLILSVKNLADSTQLEVLAYPLGGSQQPKTKAEPIGRFLLTQAGYLETAEYAQGRYVTVLGLLTETRAGRIGENEYRYPVIAAEKIHLWARDFEQSEPQFHIGIGIIMGQ